MDRTVPLLLVIFTVSSISVKLPPNFQKCNRRDPNFDDCILKAARNALPQLTKPYDEVNLPSFDPFKLTEADIGGQDGPVSLTQKFKNCKIYGLQDLKFNAFKFDLKENLIKFDGIFPYVEKICQYEMKGKILLFQINGIGDSVIGLKNLKVTDVVPFEVQTRRHKNYMKLTSSSVTLDPELVTFNFTNSVDQRLSDRINPVLNENWKEIFDDVKSGYAKIIDEIVLGASNAFFSKVSVEDLFD